MLKETHIVSSWCTIILSASSCPCSSVSLSINTCSDYESHGLIGPIANTQSMSYVRSPPPCGTHHPPYMTPSQTLWGNKCVRVCVERCVNVGAEIDIEAI